LAAGASERRADVVDPPDLYQLEAERLDAAEQPVERGVVKWPFDHRFDGSDGGLELLLLQFGCQRPGQATP